MLLNLIRLIFILLITFDVNAQGSLQNADFKTVEQLEAQGLTEEQAKAQMLHDTKVYVTTDGLNKLLSEAITDGDIGGGVTELTTDGDLLYYNSGLDRLGIGLEGQILQVSSLGFPEWADAPSVSPTTTEGDLIIRGDTEDIRLPIGTAGKILTSNGTTATWEDAPISLPDQTGQSGEFLFTNGTTASWSRVDDRINLVKNNLLANGSFDSIGISAEYTITTDALVDLTSVAARTGEIAANNINMLNIEATNGDATPYDIKAVFTKSQDFGGKQMLAFCEVKTLRPDTFFIVGANGVEQSRREIIADGSWRYYEIPFVGGDTSQFIEINGEATASQEAISVDNCFMGKVSPDYFARVSGAQFVGSGRRITSDQSINTSNRTKVQFNSANMKIGSFDTTTNYRFLPDRTGDYLVNYSVYTEDVTAGTAVLMEVQKNGVLVPTCLGFSRSNGTDPTPNITCNVRIDSTTDYIEFIVFSPDASYRIVNSEASSFNIYYYPDSTNTIVTQNTELTAQSANDFVAFVDASDVVSNQNFDWIDGNCTNASTGLATCNFKSGTFLHTPNCVATSLTGAYISAPQILSVSNTSILVATHRLDTDALVDTGFNLKCTRSTDYRKHATIVGKFENINSSELVKVEASGNGGQALTVDVTNITWSNKTVDNYNAWNGTTFTAPKDSYYLVNAHAVVTVADQRFLNTYVNNSLAFRCSQFTPTTPQYICAVTIKLNKNDTLNIRLGSLAGTLSNVTSHRLSITELPDTESIIKNLSTQKTKCQTKILASNVTASGTVSSLGFSSLVIGKTYELSYQCAMIANTSTASNEPRLRFDNGSDIVSFCRSGKNVGTFILDTSVSGSSKFKATSTTLAVDAIASTGAVVSGNGLRSGTFLQLCELPDTYVETTEW
jgi:hypothetical protein